jgi:uncharacterized protein (PEP-CTERM system associated)
VARWLIFSPCGRSLTQRLGSRLTGSIGAGWNRNERTEGVAGTDLLVGGFEGYSVDAGLSRPLGRNTDLSLRYRYYDQESEDFAFNNFTDQRVTLSVTYRF